MRAIYRASILAVKLSVMLLVASVLGTTLHSILLDTHSAMKRRAFSTDIMQEPLELVNDIEGDIADDLLLDRAVTAFPVASQKVENDSDLRQEVPATLIPFGPDESPPGKPASIPKEFPIEEADFCTKRSDIDIIAYVHSAIRNVKPRMVTRQTWANATAYNLGVKIGVVFMVGRPKNAAERMILKEESSKYHDIVQGNYGDHYRLLSYKGLAGLYWINKNCPNVTWTVHADDDVYFDTFLYYQKVKELGQDIQENQFICRHMSGPALRYGRWYVSYEQYPKLDYPLYCSGGIWFLKTKHVSSLLEASKVVPFLWVDDAYIIGLLGDKAGIKKHNIDQLFGSPKTTFEDVGKKVAWFYLPQSREEWWNAVVKYHRNATSNSTQ